MDLVYGVDVASEWLDTFNEDASFSQVKNTKIGIKDFLKELPEGATIAIESTGGYGKLLAEMAVKAGFTVYMLIPSKVKKYRQSSPYKGKTDKIDARAIHDYAVAYAKKLHPYQPLPAFEAELRRLSRARSALVKAMAKVRTQLKSLGDSPKEIALALSGLAKRLKKVDEQIAKMLASAKDAEVLFGISCVKQGVISVVLPVLRTVPLKDKYAFDSFAGMDLRPNESGKSKGRRYISKEGDKHIRTALYMAAMSAVKAKAWKNYYEKLLNEKKLKKVQALNALARKIGHTIYGVYKSQTPFEIKAPPKTAQAAA